MKIGLITTLETNIGDDFIREGICLLLKEIFRKERIEFICVNKHRPYTVYPEWHPIHLRDFAGRLPAGRDLARRASEKLLSRLKHSRFDDCDLIVQCGAPVFWPNCHGNEWAEPIWHEVISRLSERIPVLNLAAGACYPWELQPLAVEQSDDAEYIKSILGYCRLTTVRDRLARDICKSLGCEVPLIPCSALLAARGSVADIQSSGYILINYMTGGGHYAWGQDIEPDKWEETIRTLINRLRKRHKVAFLCHDEKELVLARGVVSDIPHFLPKTVSEYFACVSQAKFGVFNRMHASVAMAGLGIPSVAICTDTRLLMVAQLGLTTYYVNEVNEDILEEKIESEICLLPAEQDRLLVLQGETWDRYTSVIQDTLSLA